jgi:GT2 family glycosyltransferase
VLNVLVACKALKTPGGLKHAGITCTHYDTHPSWGVASNNLLGRALAFGGDALFLDDDVTLTVGCLDGVREHYDKADLFGLDLHTMSGERQVGARHVLSEDGAIEDWVHPGPAYVAHCSTSAMYIKASALASGVRFPIWPGLHWEDVYYCMEAWRQGLKVLAVPGRVDHAIVDGVGATKRFDPKLGSRLEQNRAAFDDWRAGVDLRRVPRGAVEL